MIRALLSVFLPLSAAVMASAPVELAAAERDVSFFKSVEGQWTGPGEVVAGKYKGTKFVCNFTGTTPSGSVGMKLDGGCRVGVFTQKMTATIQRSGKGYSGTFQDGAAGKGLDVVSGTVTEDTVVVGLNRAKLNGAMIARVRDDKTMNVTVSVKVESQMIPVIGLTLSRQVDEITVGSVE